MILRNRISIINEQEAYPITLRTRSMLRRVLNQLLINQAKPIGVEFALLLVEVQVIQELNCKYRRIDEATDVLAFPLNVGMPLAQPEDLVFQPLGDIVIAPLLAVSQARLLGHSPEEELAQLALHGLLHLLGYDHGDEADDLQLQEMHCLQQQAISVRCKG